MELHNLRGFKKLFDQRSIEAKHKEMEARDKRKKQKLQEAIIGFRSRHPISPFEKYEEIRAVRKYVTASECNCIRADLAGYFNSRVLKVKNEIELLALLNDAVTIIKYDDRFVDLLARCVLPSVAQLSISEAVLQKAAKILRRGLTAEQRRMIRKVDIGCDSFFPVELSHVGGAEADVRLYALSRIVFGAKHNIHLTPSEFIENYDRLSSEVPRDEFQKRVLSALAACEPADEQEASWYWRHLDTIKPFEYVSDDLADYGDHRRPPGRRRAELRDVIQFWLKFRSVSADPDVATQAAISSIQTVPAKHRRF